MEHVANDIPKGRLYHTNGNTQRAMKGRASIMIA